MRVEFWGRFVGLRIECRDSNKQARSNRADPFHGSEATASGRDESASLDTEAGWGLKGRGTRGSPVYVQD